MRSAVRLGRILGVEIRLDYSWFIIFVLVTWSLAGHYFPTIHPGWTEIVYWVMGCITSLVFFASVLAHELAHSLVSQAYGVPVRNITLFIFGGAAQISEEPKSARAEFLMALAGPATSVASARCLHCCGWPPPRPTRRSTRYPAGWPPSTWYWPRST